MSDGMFPTEKTTQAAQKAAQKNKSGNTSSSSSKRTTNEMDDRIPVETIEQLYQSLILPNKNHGFEMINDYMAAGFLLEPELNLVRSHSTLMINHQSLEEVLGAQQQLSRTRDILFGSMLSVAHSSKSRRGAAYDTLITQKSKSFQEIEDKTPQAEQQDQQSPAANIPDVGLQIPKQRDVSIKNNRM